MCYVLHIHINIFKSIIVIFKFIFELKNKVKTFLLNVNSVVEIIIQHI